MKLLLVFTAVFEGATGLALLLIPVVVVSVLAGAPLDTPGGLVAARLAGAALISLAITCWVTRNGERSVVTGMVTALAFYNAAAAFILAYAGIWLGLHSTLLWPAMVVHQVLLVWCCVSLWISNRSAARA